MSSTVRSRSIILDELAGWDKYSTCHATASAVTGDPDAAAVTVSNGDGVAVSGVITLPNLLVQGRVGEVYTLRVACLLGDLQ